MISLAICGYFKDSGIFIQVTRSLICKRIPGPVEENVRGILVVYVLGLWTLQMKKLEQKKWRTLPEP